MSNNVSLSFVFIFFLCYTTSTKEINHRPIIGILTIPYHGSSKSYVEDSYVKMVESSGARAVPIRWNCNRRIIDFLLNSVNGVLIPGNYFTDLVLNPRRLFGWKVKHFNKIDEAAFYILTKAFELNKKGIHFPVWLTNYGFQFLMVNFSKNRKILRDIDLEKYNSNLYFNDVDVTKNDLMKLISKNSTFVNEIVHNMNFTKKINFQNVKKFKMFKDFNENELKKISSDKTIFFNTNTGILFKDFLQNKDLVKHINPTSFVFDRSGNLTVSSFEFKDFPFYGTNFEFDKVGYTLIDHDHIMHSQSNIQINRKFADFFIEESKKNYQKFTDKRSEIKLVFESHKLHYNRNINRFIYIISPNDDEYDNVTFV